MSWRELVDPELVEAAGDDWDYLAANTGIAIGKRVGRFVTKDGLLGIQDGRVVMIKPGEEPLPERIILAWPVDEVTLVSKPKIAFGTGMVLEADDTHYHVHPEAINQGSGYVTPKKIRRARAAVELFEEALAAAKRAAPAAPSD